MSPPIDDAIRFYQSTYCLQRVPQQQCRPRFTIDHLHYVFQRAQLAAIMEILLAGLLVFAFQPPVDFQQRQVHGIDLVVGEVGEPARGNQRREHARAGRQG